MLLLGIQNDDLSRRIVLLEMRQRQCSTLIRARRTTEGVLWRSNDQQTALSHAGNLLGQKRGLWTGLPGVRHLLGNGIRRAVNSGMVKSNARGENQNVITDGTAPSDYFFTTGINTGHSVMNYIDTALLQTVVTIGDRVHSRHAHDHFITEETG